MHYVEVENLVFSYDEEPVLNGISMSVDAGEFVLLTGDNGSAKTTLLKNILGLLKPDSGRAEISSTNLYGDKMQVGYVPQMVSSYNAGFPSTVYYFVLSGRFQQGKWFGPLDDDDYRRAEESLRAVGMWDLRDRSIGDLSGGQKQRVVMARCFCIEADLLILDEPTTGLDTEARKHFYQILSSKANDKDKSVLMVSHEDIDMSAYVDRHLHLSRGGKELASI